MAKTKDEPAGAPSVYSMACRKCGMPMNFDTLPDTGAMECPECGGITPIPPELEQEA